MYEQRQTRERKKACCDWFKKKNRAASRKRGEEGEKIEEKGGRNFGLRLVRELETLRQS